MSPGSPQWFQAIINETESSYMTLESYLSTAHGVTFTSKLNELQIFVQRYFPPETNTSGKLGTIIRAAAVLLRCESVDESIVPENPEVFIIFLTPNVEPELAFHKQPPSTHYETIIDLIVDYLEYKNAVVPSD